MFTNPVADFDTDISQAWALSSLPSGTLYWRVLGIDIYGNDGPPPPAAPRSPSGLSTGVAASNRGEAIRRFLKRLCQICVHAKLHFHRCSAMLITARRCPTR